MDNLIDFDMLRAYCAMGQDEFRALGEVILSPDGRFSVYIDRGGSTLAVAHVDTVNERERESYHFALSDDKRLVFCPRLDDRLGVYVALELLPSLGITSDVLLTTGEEVLRSSAREWEPRKAYNWVYQFDRHGNDTVLYQYDSPELRELLTGFGFKVGKGSYSDICELGRLGVAGFNFGCGYWDEHSIGACADMGMLRAQVGRFVHFWRAWSGNKLAYAGREVARASGVWGWAQVRGDEVWHMAREVGFVYEVYEDGKLTVFPPEELLDFLPIESPESEETWK